MKKLSLLILMATLTVFVACKDDDTTPNELTVDGEKFDIPNVYYFELSDEEPKRVDAFLPTNLRGNALAGLPGSSEGVEAVFVATDGDYDGQSCTDCNFIFQMILISTDATELESGEFSVYDYFGAQSEPEGNVALFIGYSFDSDGKADLENGFFTYSQGGTAKINIGESSYKFNLKGTGYDFTAEAESPADLPTYDVKFTYSGEVEVVTPFLP